MSNPRDILDFWFSEKSVSLWYAKDDAFDAEIRERFGADATAAQRGALDHWQESAEGTLALLVLLDQFPRNLHRGSAAAFLGDEKARAVADAAIARGLDRQFPTDRRHLFYLPFMHSESAADQDRSLGLYRQLLADAPEAERQNKEIQLRFAEEHRDIILRFGRYPHRNAALGRENTEAEAIFLRDHKGF